MKYLKQISVLAVLLASFLSCEMLGTRSDEPAKQPEYKFTANETTTYKLQLQIEYSGKILGFGEEGTLNITGNVLLNCTAASAEGYRITASTASIEVTGGSASIRNEVKNALRNRMAFAIDKYGKITSEYVPMSSDDALLLETFVLPVLKGSTGNGTVTYRQDPIRVSMAINSKKDEAKSAIKWEKTARLTDQRDNSNMGSISVAQSFSVSRGLITESSYQGDVTINVPAQSGGFTVNIPVKTRFQGKLTL